MKINLNKGNELLVELTKRYNNIAYENITVATPYFINTAEQVYKQAMKNAGIEDDLISKAIQLVKDGKTSLGSTGGKGSPELLTQDLKRMMGGINELGYHSTNVEMVRKWMVQMHIGLDCSGYVYNVLASIEKDQEIDILKHLAWADPKSMKPSHAGAFIFDSENLEKVVDYKDLKPLDILILKNHTHIGILAEYDGNLCLADCSMGRNGVAYSKLVTQDGTPAVENDVYWTKSLRDDGVVVRRIDLCH